MASDTRQRILRALRGLLATGGTDAVTLDAVAAAAGVSKGGLLYHFPSKAALYSGLLDAVRETVDHEMAQCSAALGAARGFLEYSTPTEDDEVGFFTSLIAAVRSGQGGEQDGLREQLTAIFQAWEDPMRAVVADPIRAEIIRLVGFGLYFAELVGLDPVPADTLEQVFRRVLLPDAPTGDRPLPA